MLPLVVSFKPYQSSNNWPCGWLQATFSLALSHRAQTTFCGTHGGASVVVEATTLIVVCHGSYYSPSDCEASITPALSIIPLSFKHGSIFLLLVVWLSITANYALKGYHVCAVLSDFDVLNVGSSVLRPCGSAVHGHFCRFFSPRKVAFTTDCNAVHSKNQPSHSPAHPLCAVCALGWRLRGLNPRPTDGVLFGGVPAQHK